MGSTYFLGFGFVVQCSKEDNINEDVKSSGLYSLQSVRLVKIHRIFGKWIWEISRTIRADLEHTNLRSLHGVWDLCFDAEKNTKSKKTWTRLNEVVQKQYHHTVGAIVTEGLPGGWVGTVLKHTLTDGDMTWILTLCLLLSGLHHCPKETTSWNDLLQHLSSPPPAPWKQRVYQTLLSAHE